MKTEGIPISIAIREVVNKAIEANLLYEQITTNCGRKLGITGEVGEILVCAALGLHLVKDPRAEGFDAVDSSGNRIQIKVDEERKPIFQKTADDSANFRSLISIMR